MARLNWDAPGERFYETGVDRGVLFVGGVGVPWNGLTAVRERPTGGNATPYYIDGLKYINISSSEEFEATLEAYSSPKEFAACDGTVAISNGLFVGQQPRKPFAFSYRTKVGNDIDGLDHGYKLHIVYNALAEPASRNNNTIDNAPDPKKLSWDISTTQPRTSGFRPTAHFVIDSRLTPPKLLAHLEDILYGTDVSQPSLPTPTELVDLFNSPGPERRRNLAINPKPTTISGWVRGATLTATIVDDEGQPAIQITASDETSGGQSYTYTGGRDFTPPGVGRWVALGVDLKPLTEDIVSRMRLLLRTQIATANVDNVYVPAVGTLNQWTRHIHAIQQTSDADNVDAFIWPTSMPNGSSYLARNAVVAYADTEAEARAMVATKLDGDMPSEGGLTRSWVGAPNASQSIELGWVDLI